MDSLLSNDTLNLTGNVTSRTLSVQVADEMEMLKRAMFVLWNYVSPLILALGTIGNIFILLLMPFVKNFSSSIRLSFFTLSISDLGVLWTGLFRYILITTMKTDVRTSGPIACKVHLFATYFFTHSSAWVLVFLSLERVTCVVAPVTARHCFTGTRAGIYLAIILAVIGLIDTSFFWSVQHTGGHGCGKRLALFPDEVWAIVHLGVASILPFAIMITCSIIIIVNLKKRTKHVSSRYATVNSKKKFSRRITRKRTCSDDSLYSTKKTTCSKRKKADRYVTKTLLTTNVIFVFLTLPMCCVLIFRQFYEFTDHPLAPDRYRLAFAVCYQLFACNSAINFVLYYVCGKPFRRSVKRLLETGGKCTQ